MLELASYVLMALAHTGVLFTAWSVLGAFGSGFGPSMSSVATALYTRNGGKELGKLFGALSVVQIVWCVAQADVGCSGTDVGAGLARRSLARSCMG